MLFIQKYIKTHDLFVYFKHNMVYAKFIMFTMDDGNKKRNYKKRKQKYEERVQVKFMFRLNQFDFQLTHI